MCFYLQAVSKIQPGNLIVSPTSVATILALLQQGTYGDAQNEITNSLQMPPEITAPTYKRLTIDMRVWILKSFSIYYNH